MKKKYTLIAIFITIYMIGCISVSSENEDTTLKRDSRNAGLAFEYDPQNKLDTCIKYKKKTGIYLYESCTETYSVDSCYYFEGLQLNHNHDFPNLIWSGINTPLVYKMEKDNILIKIVSMGVTNITYSFTAKYKHDTITIERLKKFQKGYSATPTYKKYILKINNVENSNAPKIFIFNNQSPKRK